MPRKAKSSPKSRTPKSRRSRRTREEVQALMDSIHSDIAGGATIKDALKKAGVSYSNYNYWRKREGAPARRGKGGAPRTANVMGLLEEMTRNRREAESLRQKLSHLDSRFETLKKQLEKSNG